jgi:hypothetical protein
VHFGHEKAPRSCRDALSKEAYESVGQAPIRSDLRRFRPNAANAVPTRPSVAGAGGGCSRTSDLSTTALAVASGNF